ncbi:MAG: AlkZ family DNA glycosylase [Chloroflexi bacterium]|nr:AlkZ family DNA glycosylase [Chloroflexota bacterium]
MAGVARIGIEERRARLGRRHRLAYECAADTPIQVAESLVALHATDASTVFLSVRARMRQPTPSALERALYDDKQLVRMLGMRRTMFVVPLELMPVVSSACTQAIAAQERKRTIELLERAGITDDATRWLDEAESETLAAFTRRDEALAAELSREVPRLNERIRMAQGKAYEGWLSMSTRVLFLLSAEGKLVRGRPRGTWTSSQHRWARTDTWLPSLPAEVPKQQAQAELLRRWLQSFGPGTLTDLRWWTGLGAREIQQALAQLNTCEVDLDGAPGVMLRDDVEPIDQSAAWVALLPALDPTPMGWASRDWFLGEYGPHLFDRSGNIGPTVWCNGKIIGGWAQRKSGEVVFKLFEDVGRELVHEVERQASELANWLGEIRLTPRFRTPLERELSA